MKSYFVTATGTNIGKTFFCENLISLLREQKQSIKVIKPIVTGFRENDSNNDTIKLASALGHKDFDLISPFRFATEFSPDISAIREKMPFLDYQKVKNFCEEFLAESESDLALIEGIGGLMVPINQQKTILDLISDLGIEIILLAGNYLGTISHSLNAIRLAEMLGIKIKALVINDIVSDRERLFWNANSIGNFYSKIFCLSYKTHSDFPHDLKKILNHLLSEDNRH